ncbi:hypothetical protein MKEN_00555700 [Mycena kentingensis (nom. inval.)]|nr:hypothetical protein MKEN_00555700 [Mycena kentingensis (nom. inval.)]
MHGANIEPRLPPELERLVAETTAFTHRKCIPHLLLVARRFHIWIHPLRYRVIQLKRTTQQPILMALRHNRDALRTGLRALCLDVDGKLPQKHILDIISLGEHIEDLGVVPNFCSPRFLAAYSLLPLVRFTGLVGDLFGGDTPVDPRHPFFARITHLELFDDFPGSAGALEREPFPWLQRLPALTHVSFADRQAIPPAMERWIGALLEGMPQLVLFVLVWVRSDVRGHRATIDELGVHDAGHRFMAGSYPQRGGNMWYEWYAAASPGTTTDYWERGEEFLRRKKAKEVDVSRRWMDDWMYDVPGLSPEERDGDAEATRRVRFDPVDPAEYFEPSLWV